MPATRPFDRRADDLGSIVALDALERRLGSVAARLAGTRFEYTRDDKCITAVSPWGNVMRCYAPRPCFGRMRLGMPYVAFVNRNPDQTQREYVPGRDAYAG